MGIETPVIDRRAPYGSADQTTRATRLARVGHDVLTLFELQMKLVRLDAERVTRKAVTGAMCLVGAAALAIGGLTIVLAGSGAWLASTMNWQQGPTLLSVGAAAIVVSAGIAAAGAVVLRSLRNAFHNSSTELQRNIETLKNSLMNES